MSPFCTSQPFTTSFSLAQPYPAPLERDSQVPSKAPALTHKLSNLENDVIHCQKWISTCQHCQHPSKASFKSGSERHMKFCKLLHHLTHLTFVCVLCVHSWTIRLQCLSLRARLCYLSHVQRWLAGSWLCNFWAQAGNAFARLGDNQGVSRLAAQIYLVARGAAHQDWWYAVPTYNISIYIYMSLLLCTSVSLRLPAALAQLASSHTTYTMLLLTSTHCGCFVYTTVFLFPRVLGFILVWFFHEFLFWAHTGRVMLTISKTEIISLS